MEVDKANSKRYDLEERTYLFANSTKEFLKGIDKNIHNVEYYKQLIRSSGSVAANLIEAIESFSRNDYSHRIKICRKEAKESILWLKLIDVTQATEAFRDAQIQEATELMRIFGAILEKMKANNL
ncbi:four helix bundle protein [Mucilaginibacter rigui]|uniref:Four helix bundle protein n=1 Tax=Mucilaginibacter rigui TaxID=534635 RepID=A0ABR7X3J3_9SPHI|nr:four helix bundle protein [Mucilaginibacter rigui]MBD1385165.1 four helix bundle protein [Mucilaginibacter rigui]